MNTISRNFVLAFSLSASVASLGACDRDSKPVGDVLAQDSTLNLAVMSANQDTMSPAETDSLKPSPKGASTAAVPASTRAQTAQTAQTAKGAQITPRRASRRVGSVRKLFNPRGARARTVRDGRLVSSPPSRRVRTRRSVAAASAPAGRAAVSRTITAERSPVATTEGTTAGPVTTVVTTPSQTRATSATIPIGASLALTTSQQICTNTSKVGQQFNTRLAKDVMGPAGVVIPEGTPAIGEIASIGNGDPGIAIRIASLTFGGRTYPVGSQVVYTEVDRVQTSSHNSAAKIAVGAGIGALLGRVIGGNTKSTVIGAVGGAAAGGVIGSRGGGQYAHCVPNGGQIIARLTEPLRVPLAE